MDLDPDHLAAARRGASLPPLRSANGQAIPFTALRDLQRAYQPALSEERPPGGPFQSGLVGYFGYETGYAIESISRHRRG